LRQRCRRTAEAPDEDECDDEDTPLAPAVERDVVKGREQDEAETPNISMMLALRSATLRARRR
jgi:hypothetical protein